MTEPAGFDPANGNWPNAPAAWSAGPVQPTGSVAPGYPTAAGQPIPSQPGPYPGGPPTGGYYPPPQPPPAGYAPVYAAPMYLAPARPTNGVGTAGFILGLLGLIFVWFPYLGIILGVLGIILGGVGISSAKRSGASSGLAVAGLVLGLIAVGLWVILVAAAVSVFGTLA